MSNKTAFEFKAMRLTCAWSDTPRHENMLDILAVNVARFSMSQEKAWALYVNDRAGLVSQVADIARSWVLHDRPTWGDKMLHIEVVSLSAN